MNPAGDTADPYLRSEHIFPILSQDQADRVERYGRRTTLEEGEVLFDRGDRLADFFLVREGRIGIFIAGEKGSERLLTTHCAGQFTGELDHFSARALLVGARALTRTCVVRVSTEGFRQLMTAQPDVGEIIIRAFILRRMGFIHRAEGGIVLVGHPRESDTLRLERFSIRNGYPIRLIDADDAAAYAPFVAPLAGAQSLPAVVFPDGNVMHNPSIMDLADRLGLTTPLDPDDVWDVAIIGAGPAGLAAATYAASEGLRTIVIEMLAPGGQAGTSSRIENYLGFPTGITGQALAGRAQVQAQKFGARIAVSRRAVKLDCSGSPLKVELEDGRVVSSRTVVVASGAQYRRLNVDDLDRFEGRGVHYAATPMEATLCRDEDVVVVGAGNSAGQAAVFLAGFAKHVHMIVRRDALGETMSEYLVQRILHSEHITLYLQSEISTLAGDTALERIVWMSNADGATTTVEAANLFVMIGAEPNTGWLEDCLPLDERGFVLTGATATSPYETSVPGVFAIGDVRSGSIKRVAASVGEGSVVVQQVHRYFRALQGLERVQ
ncbi:FAD-dependent oxidoreductase [Qipengyuania sp. GH25]|uniref:Thioredoxin reductase n=1 Tax=Qipengyuania pacifica TaxID=2860199 RepID=A0ABS7JJK4_9SPHN|nr:FAD-dependent oxidoreductase [Qipengyuania aerophila]MBX7489530.1 FAD-dependent oxidoreductase [Qipengyuania aerophila]